MTAHTIHALTATRALDKVPGALIAREVVLGAQYLVFTTAQEAVGHPSGQPVEKGAVS